MLLLLLVRRAMGGLEGEGRGYPGVGDQGWGRA